MSKRKKLPALPVPQTFDEADKKIAELGVEMRRLQVIETQMNGRMTSIKEDAENQAAPIKTHIAQIEQALQSYAEARRTELTEDGKRKTVEFPSGIIRWRNTPPKVTIRNVEMVLADLIRLRLKKFLRRKFEINKEAMQADPARAKEIPGVSIGGTETFEVLPLHVELAPPEAAQ